MIALDWVGTAILVVVAAAVLRLMVLSVREDRAAAKRRAAGRGAGTFNAADAVEVKRFHRPYGIRRDGFLGGDPADARNYRWNADNLEPEPPLARSEVERHIREAVAMATPQPPVGASSAPFRASTGCTVQVEDHVTHRCMVVTGPGPVHHRVRLLLPPLGTERLVAGAARTAVASGAAPYPAHYLALAEYLESIAVEAAS